MVNFFKGIIIGIGGIAPGLSGSVLLVIFGLYQKTVQAIGTLFQNFRKNLAFLVPLFAGFGVGVLLFSKVVSYLLKHFEFQTRFAFLGLIAGTVPLFYKEVKKEGFSRIYWLPIGASLLFGIVLFYGNRGLFPTVTDPSLFQSVILGVAVAGSSIIPGVDSAAILSSLGLYELYVNSLADFQLHILIPAGFGLLAGALVISFVMNYLIRHFYTITFSVIFGLFLSVIPGVLNKACTVNGILDAVTAISFSAVGFTVSFCLGTLKKES